ncbi:hypothetical protein BDW60DRAFT_203381 [Aspergillus nidulans var. acristatus]|jgi:hypothetical protein
MSPNLVSNFSKVPQYYHKALGHRDAGADKVPNCDALSMNIGEGRSTIEVVQRFDADPNLSVIAAHNTSISPILVLSSRNANDWKEKDLKEKGCWLFSTDFEGGLELAGATQV